MHNYQYIYRLELMREARLLRKEDSRPFLRRVADETLGLNSGPSFLNPEKAKQQDLLSDRSKLSAFERPDIFNAETDPSLAGGNNTERLLSMTSARRLEEFTAFVNQNIPEATRARFPEIFDIPLDAVDVEEQKKNVAGNRLDTLLTVLKILAGDRIPAEQNILAFNIAKDAAQESNDTSNAPGEMYRQYEQWLDTRTDISEEDATSPEILLKNNSGISDKLRGLLGNLVEPSVQRQMLKDMYELYRKKQTDTRLTSLQAREDRLAQTASIKEREIAREGRGFIENFQNASPGLKIAAIGTGLFLGLRLISKNKDGKMNHPILFTGALAALGYFGYDRFINGNENALDDMANGLQKIARFNGNLLKNVAKEFGLLPRSEADRLELMGDFLMKNRLGTGPAQTGMAALAQVKLGTIADAFVPYLEGGTLGGTLSVTDDTVAGKLLRKELKQTMNGLRSSEKEATFQYLESNNGEISQALAHVFYMIGGSENRNLSDVEEIDKAILNQYGSPEALPNDLKTRYMRIALEGREIAQTRHKNKSFVDIIASLNTTKEKEAERKPDNAVSIPDPKTADRVQEFTALETLRDTDVTTADVPSILRDGGAIDFDCQEFLRNCEASEVLNADAAFALGQKFIVIRRESANLTEALQTIEKLKYAVLVQSTQKEGKLTKDDIALLSGPDERSVSSMLNTVTGFLGRFVSVPRGFQSVSSMADIRSILNEPWFGSGPVSSQGEGFDRLTERLSIYERKFAEMRDTAAVAKTLVSQLDSSVTRAFGSKAEAEAFVVTLLQNSNYAERINHNEAHLSQRMANALARSMRLRDTGTAFGSFDELGITPTEQKNLALEFDRLFIDIVGDPSKLALSMWQKSEDVDVFEKFDLTALNEYDYSGEDERMDAIQYARDLGAMHGIRVLSDLPDEKLREEAKKRAIKIYEKMLAEKTKELQNDPEIKPVSATNTPAREEQQLKNLYAALLIENKTSYTRESFTELRNIITFLGGEVTEDTGFENLLATRELFPENLEQSRPYWKEFVEKWNPILDTDIVGYWKNLFSGLFSVPPETLTPNPGTTPSPTSSPTGAPTSVPSIPPVTPDTLKKIQDAIDALGEQDRLLFVINPAFPGLLEYQFEIDGMPENTARSSASELETLDARRIRDLYLSWQTLPIEEREKDGGQDPLHPPVQVIPPAPPPPDMGI